ncbi:ORC1-type DNA replication protein [Marine Group I thaumarchaeote SCGC AAA799-P11]|uniref:ORC1-type DNA replication protein n=1 Tax=Marine Group I thaumarchaeote SCGC AAA799-P11 TaxID=1502295 RepID=A0A087S2Q3_9ARCH|nr:ORC1-type DNA replication protein [Marine Group I thaumarchaeote SCGC AAA799-P11]
MNKKSLKRRVSDVQKQNSLFSDKSYLDNLSIPSDIIGRESQTRKLVEHLLGFQKGLVVPMVSVYGRSGSGKSSLVKFVCNNLDDTQTCFVDLRKAKTVFGCANLILSELGAPEIKSAVGLNGAIKAIESAVFSQLKSGLFVLCLDEFDSLFFDKRGKPSDFIYKLILLIEKLRSKNLHMCIITISNKILSDFDLDDRVLSRIGTSEIFFDSFSRVTFSSSSFRILTCSLLFFSSSVSSLVLSTCIVWFCLI